MVHYAVPGGDIFIEHTNCACDPDTKARLGSHACVTTLTTWARFTPEGVSLPGKWEPLRPGGGARIHTLVGEGQDLDAIRAADIMLR